LHRPYVDSDAVIVERAGRSIQAMFRAGEEGRFREMEREVISELTAAELASVISLGGGALNDDRTLQLLLDRALLVHIHLPWESFEKLIPKLRRGRPLLMDATSEEVHALFIEREARYRSCHLTVELRREGVKRSALTLLEALAPYGIKGPVEQGDTSQLP
jgi:shikimate kinase